MLPQLLTIWAYSSLTTKAVILGILSTLSSLDVVSAATTHKLVVGTFSSRFLYTLEYDDGNGNLALVSKSPHDKTKLYGTDWNVQEPTFVSYDAADPYDIKVEAKIVAGSLCSGSKSIFVNAFQQPPYSMHGNYYYGDARCSTVMSGHENGTLKEVIQEYVYAADSAVHGTAITPNGLFLLSADTKANLIWFHAIDGATGLLSNLTSIAGPSEGSGPRHAVVHTSGDFLYVVLEEASEATNYYIFPGGSLMLVGSHYELLKVEDPSDYWADEISLSIDNKYLWATTRARNNSQKGHISAFELNAGGAIEKHMFLLETSTSGGFANSVEASPFNISIAALTDNSTGFVDIWDVGGGMIAHLAIPDGQGCCANAVLVGLIKSKRIWGRLVH